MRDGQTSKLNPPPASIDPGPQVLLRLLLGMTDGLLQLKKKHMRIEVCYIGTTGVCWCFMGFIQNGGMLRVSCRVTMG